MLGIVVYYIRTPKNGESTSEVIDQEIKEMPARKIVAEESNKHDLTDTHQEVYENGDHHFYGKDANGTEHTWLTVIKEIFK